MEDKIESFYSSTNKIHFSVETCCDQTILPRSRVHSSASSNEVMYFEKYNIKRNTRFGFKTKAHLSLNNGKPRREERLIKTSYHYLNRV